MVLSSPLKLKFLGIVATLGVLGSLGCNSTPSKTEARDLLGLSETITLEYPLEITADEDTCIVLDATYNTRYEEQKTVLERYLLPTGHVVEPGSDGKAGYYKLATSLTGEAPVMNAGNLGYAFMFERDKKIMVRIGRREDIRFTKYNAFEESGQKRTYAEFEYTLVPTISGLEEEIQQSGRAELAFSKREQEWEVLEGPGFSMELYYIKEWLAEASL